MQDELPTHPIAYTDASHRTNATVRSGCGYIVRTGGRIVLGSCPAVDMTSSQMAEAHAIFLAVKEILALDPKSPRVEVRTDSLAIVQKAELADTIDMEDIRAALDLCRAAGTQLVLTHCKGHSGTGLDAGFLNHCADLLASWGADGETVRHVTNHDAFWRMHIMECDPRLLVDGAGLTRLESAGYLGLEPEVVDLLLRNDHLRTVPGRSLLSAESLTGIRRQIIARGHDIPPRMEPLAPMLGRIDEASSGFGTRPPSNFPVRAVVQIQECDDDIRAAISLETQGSAEIFAVRFPHVQGPSWEPVLQGIVDLVRDRHPGCDRLVLGTTNRSLADALNGLGPYGSMCIIEDLDRCVRDAEMRVEALYLRLQIKVRGWQVRLGRSVLDALVEHGAEGAWEVAARFGHTQAKTAAALDYEPPWTPESRIVAMI